MLQNNIPCSRIVHVNTHDIAGGASKVAWRLAECQRKLGKQAQLLVGYKKSETNNSIYFDPAPLPGSKYYNQGLLYYEYQGSHNLVENEPVLSSDVVHFHNLHGDYFNPFSISGISLLKPVVWTLHDMQSFTGHCAHSFDCDRWEKGCGECPNLNIYPELKIDSTVQLLEDKRKIYDQSKLNIVCPSNWLKTKVERSILSKHPVELIYNSVDTDIFQPCEKKQARLEFGFPLDSILIGSVADGGSFKNQWKGGTYTLKILNELWRLFPDLYFINIGGTDDGSVTNPRIIEIPKVAEESTLARLYSAMDFYIYTSLADTCPLVVIEALSCGLPVVSFDTGGIPELVRNGIDGFVAPRMDAESMVKNALKMITDHVLRQKFSIEARKGVLSRFRQDIMVDKYQRLYERVFEDYKKNSRSLA